MPLRPMVSEENNIRDDWSNILWIVMNVWSRIASVVTAVEPRLTPSEDENDQDDGVSGKGSEEQQ